MHTGHWIFTPSVQCIIEQKTIVFSFHNLHKVSNKLQGYARCMGRTLPMDCRTMTPKDGEVILSMFKCPQSKQMLVHP